MARAFILPAILLPAALYGQTGGLTGVIVSRSGEPLPYGIVGVENPPRLLFTDESGRFSFHELPAGMNVVRVRRLGFLPREMQVEVHANAVDTLRIELDRLAVSLAAVDVKAYPPCTNPGAPTRNADSTLAAIVEQIRLNAEQYKFLASQYPFTYTVAVASWERRKLGDTLTRPQRSVTGYDSRTKPAYKRGDVVHRSGRNSYFAIPTLVDVADKSFLGAHCWYYAGVDTIDDQQFFKVDVVAFDSLKGPDVNGTFYVHHETFQIKRSVLRLSRRINWMPDVHDLETTTDFLEILPSIPVVDHVQAVQTMDPYSPVTFTEGYEEQRTVNFKFLGRKPGDVRKPKP